MTNFIQFNYTILDDLFTTATEHLKIFFYMKVITFIYILQTFEISDVYILNTSIDKI